MTKNVGVSDRALRVIVGVALLGFGFMTKSYWGLVGLVPLATASMSWCPLYVPFGLTTCKTGKAKT